MRSLIEVTFLEISQMFRDDYATLNYSHKNNARFDNDLFSFLDKSVRTFAKMLPDEITLNDLQNCFRDLKCRTLLYLNKINIEVKH
jgi:hypothetical protein